jgi:hypothetical protein
MAAAEPHPPPPPPSLYSETHTALWQPLASDLNSKEELMRRQLDPELVQIIADRILEHVDAHFDAVRRAREVILDMQLHGYMISRRDHASDA